MNHREIDLSIKEIKVLKHFQHKPNTEIGNYQVDTLEKLIDLDLIYITNQTEFEIDQYIKFFTDKSHKIQHQKFSLTPNGEMYLHFYRKDLLRTYLPISLSIIAIFISLVALYFSI